MTPSSHTHEPPLVELEQVGCALGGQPVLHDLTWRLSPGQHWAVLGGNGAGKSTFLRLVRGELWPLPESRQRRRYLVEGRVTTSPLSFREHTSLVSSELLARYQHQNWSLNGLEVVVSGLTGGHLLYSVPAPVQWERAQEVLERLELTHLAERDILTMSQGQAKQVLIARALINRPRLLILDEPCEGLDAASRTRLLAMLGKVMAHGGTQVLYATHRGSELAPGTSHAMIMEHGAIKAQGPLAEVLDQGGADLAPPAVTREHIPSPAMANNDPFLVRVEAPEVYVEHQLILRGLDWEIQPGSNWLVLGPNGAGKTTLLRLLAGELRPALGGSVAWFGRGGRRNLQDLRTRVSLVSAAWQTRHMHSQSGVETVASGLSGSVGPVREPDPAHHQAARAWLKRLGLEELGERDITTLSYGQLRKLLIARAMINQPRLLLLDEPLAGLDAPARAEVGALLARLAGEGATLVGVSHYPGEMLPYMSHVALMDQGRMVFQGSAAQYLAAHGSLA
ncbi:MAG: ATP-binding cassette domain-containing protein [Desulfarculaceae bacterium]|nr:ATP-binding cassette domain-containing protein [Desulfarculaceae bacterium]MCF8071743.1 ATP-binding cassette domain-containing protein [Desulfarculaceae bacterium]MCF8101293.1 ATP-binding cassette domain-containing protein [Desulfarculaceae bacterium]MCF8117252.1 ATP-binding cassette domain-containing protein [Desulfarculaceae bacterium]